MAKSNPNTYKEKQRSKEKSWPIVITIVSFILSFAISFIADVFMRSVGLGLALLALFALILLGIVADVIGTAVTAADDKPFVAMAAKKIPGAKQCIFLIRRADRVSSILNDVIGDICAIVSGAAGSVIVYYLATLGLSTTLGTMLISAATASIMIGGKAVGKRFALVKSREIVNITGKLLMVFSFSNKKGRKQK